MPNKLSARIIAIISVFFVIISIQFKIPPVIADDVTAPWTVPEPVASDTYDHVRSSLIEDNGGNFRLAFDRGSGYYWSRKSFSLTAVGQIQKR